MIVDVAAYRQVTGDAFPADAVVLTNLARAQSRVERRTGRLFDKVERTESLPVRDGLVWPTAYPIASVSLPATAVVTDDKLAIKLNVTNWQDDPALVSLTDGATPAYYAVTYVGGFTPATTSYLAGEAPVELVDIICELAQRYAMPANTAAVPAGATSLSVNGQSVSGGRLGGSSSIPPALATSIRRFNHITQRMGD